MATQCVTLFTSAGGTDLQYSANEWTLVSVQLETAGPVVIGTQEHLAPLGSGRGISVGTTPRYMVLSPGERLYSLSSALNRVSMVAQPLPNLVAIALKIDALIGALAKKIGFLKP